ncbi:MAG TPA: late promoter transcription accessory protein [Anaerovoracaceae bacterium]|nr:late promoter transcription accessory protein [Anaerovoracaceae bacterium]
MSFSIHTSETIAKHIEQQVATGSSYIDAVLHFCEARAVEPEAVAPFLNANIIAQIGKEGRNLHLLVGDDTESSLF